MTKRTRIGYMTPGEEIAGTILFMLYLLALPFVAPLLFRWAEGALDVALPSSLQNVIYYYAIFAAAIIIFHGFLARTTRQLFDNLGAAAKTLLLGLIALYGLNELGYRLAGFVTSNRTDLNEWTLVVPRDSARWMTVVTVVLLIPFLEETLFRGLVFGGLKSRSRVLAYGVSCLLFALFHAWQFVSSGQGNSSYILMTAQYLVPGAVLAWSYEASGTLWTPIALHALASGLALAGR